MNIIEKQNKTVRFVTLYAFASQSREIQKVRLARSPVMPDAFVYGYQRSVLYLQGIRHL